MTQHTISYNVATEAASSITVPATVSGTETDMFVCKDPKYHQKSQLTAFYNVTLSANSLKIRYFHSLDNGSTWLNVPIKNLATGQLSDIPSLIDSTSYQNGSSQSVVIEDIPMSGTTAFKITGQASSGTVTINSVRVAVRDN